MSAYYRYNITFGFEMEKAYRLLNKAFGCNMKNNSDKYIGDGFKLSMDGDMVFVYFKSIENREFVRSIIDKVADALCADRYYDLYDDEDDCEVSIPSNVTVTATATATVNNTSTVSVSAIGKYTTTFGELDSERSYKLINKALGFKALKDGCDTYTADNYTIMMDYSMMYMHFTSVEDTEYVRGIITMIAEALGDEPEHHFELYNEETDDYVYV